MPHYTTDPYPHKLVHPHLRRVIEAFGPRRVFWGTDMTKLARGGYREATVAAVASRAGVARLDDVAEAGLRDAGRAQHRPGMTES